MQWRTRAGWSDEPWPKIATGDDDDDDDDDDEDDNEGDGDDDDDDDDNDDDDDDDEARALFHHNYQLYKKMQAGGVAFNLAKKQDWATPSHISWKRATSERIQHSKNRHRIIDIR